MNRYLQNKASRDGARGRGRDRADGRNPYGSRGGYVTSRRGRRDRDMADYGDYDMARGGRGRDRDSDMARGRDRARGGQDGHYEMYGIGGMRPMDYARGGGRGRDRDRGQDYGMEDYDYDMGDYDNDYGYDMGDYADEDMEEEWKQHLKKWTEKLKKKDRFNMPKDQVLQNAKQMGVKFDEYSEEEFLTTYYMVISDYPKVANEPHTYLAMAKEWLEDKDSELKGSEKLCAYYYEIIKGGEE